MTMNKVVSAHASCVTEWSLSGFPNPPERRRVDEVSSVDFHAVDVWTWTTGLLILLFGLSNKLPSSCLPGEGGVVLPSPLVLALYAVRYGCLTFAEDVTGGVTRVCFDDAPNRGGLASFLFRAVAMSMLASGHLEGFVPANLVVGILLGTVVGNLVVDGVELGVPGRFRMNRGNCGRLRPAS